MAANDWTLHDSWQYQGFEAPAVAWTVTYWTPQEAAFNVVEEGGVGAGNSYLRLFVGIG